jgi:hypothetical protein
VSTLAVTAFGYAKHQEQFTKQGGQLPQEGAVRWSLQLQCKLIGDGPKGWLTFANKLEELGSVVHHLGGLHGSEPRVAVDTKGSSGLA